MAMSFGQLGRLSESQGKFEEAIKRLKKALQIMEKIGLEPYIRLARKDIDRIQTKMKQQKQH